MNPTPWCSDADDDLNPRLPIAKPLKRFHPNTVNLQHADCKPCLNFRFQQPIVLNR